MVASSSSLRKRMEHPLSANGRSKLCTFLLAMLASSPTSSSFCPAHPGMTGHFRRVHSGRRTDQRLLLRRWSKETRAFMTSTTDTLAECILQSYEESETDGILALAASMDQADFNVENIIHATEQAAGDNKGKIASILNAFIGSCCVLPDGEVATARVVELLEAYESLTEERGIAPDVVSLSLAFRCFQQQGGSSEMADYVLDKAARMSKKAAGNKRRKALAASRRKRLSTCADVEEKLKDLCGADFRVLFETDELVVINKPSGIPCFHKKLTTAGKIRKGKGKDSKGDGYDVSLEDALLSCNVPLSTLNPESFGLVHRLDRASSGCLVLAKSDAMHAQLLAEFFLRRTQKKYLALLQNGSGAEIPGEGYITTAVDGRPAKSSFRLQESFGDQASLVEFEIETGRKHQIRVHSVEALSSPVMLDDLYDTSSEQGADEIKHLLAMKDTKDHIFLHASSLSIPGCGVKVESPCPSWWDPVLEYLKEQ